MAGPFDENLSRTQLVAVLYNSEFAIKKTLCPVPERPEDDE
jgi:hypothetical protein